MTRSAATRLSTPKLRARSKKKAQRRVIVSESLEDSVALSERTASSVDEYAVEEEDL